MEFLHPAMWHDHDIDFASTLQCGRWLWDDMPLNSSKRPPYWKSTSDFDFAHITAVDMSFYTSLRNFIQIGPPQQKKMTSCRFSRWRISAILDFRGPIMGSLKSPCTTSYRSSIDTIALNCFVFEKIAFLYFGDRQTDKQTDERMDRPVAWSRSCCREWRLNNSTVALNVEKLSKSYKTARDLYVSSLKTYDDTQEKETALPNELGVGNEAGG